MIELLQNVNVVIGVIIGAFTVLSGVIFWVERRQKSFAKSAVREASKASDGLAVKVDHLEEDVGAVAKDVVAVKRDLTALSSRVHGVEKSMETVARQSALADLKTEVAHLGGSVTAELRVLSGLMHSFRESAYRAAEKRTGK
ncbi:hypothetical protein KX928_12685 [Roseobacter sp. YSTF-M11]|uniref:Uncharacterized protein n=1 Tax=Roseobacter insulae TaxID=2859783 RepID=A0A9X1FW22_9RHOB|nr:hypothetical protein [Roseobacter insulae]MBW4708641.1 hypothetical protein [Roseobacter insulae]